MFSYSDINGVPCAVASDLSRYYNECEERDRFEAKMEAHREMLLTTTYAAHAIDNLMEFFPALNDEEIAHVAQLIKDGDEDKAAKTIFAVYKEHLDDQAIHTAEMAACEEDEVDFHEPEVEWQH